MEFKNCGRNIGACADESQTEKKVDTKDSLRNLLMQSSRTGVRISIDKLTPQQIKELPGFSPDMACCPRWREKDLEPNGEVSEMELAGRRLYNQLMDEDAKRKKRDLEAYMNQESSKQELPTSSELAPKHEAQSMMEISRMPIRCPHCARIISPSDIMQHFVSYHVETGQVLFVALYDGHRFVQMVSPCCMKLGQNTAIAIYAYGGARHHPDQTLIKQELAMPNAPLRGPFARFRYHTPILLMACRTSWNAVLNGKMDDDQQAENEMWILWVLSAQLLKPIYLTLTIFDKFMTKSLSRVLRVRNTSQTQRCEDIFLKDTNYLMLRYDDVKSMTYNFMHHLRIEMYVSEPKELQEKAVEQSKKKKKRQEIDQN